MDPRLLDACAELLRASLAPRVQILAVDTPDPRRIQLLVEKAPPENARARIVADLDPGRACLYIARPAPAAAPAVESSLGRSLIGRWILGIDRPVDQPVLRFRVASPEDPGAEDWLLLEWLGAAPAAVLVAADSLAVRDTLGGDAGPQARRRGKGASYQWPPPPRRLPAREATAETVAPALEPASEAERVRALVRRFADLLPPLAYEALHSGGGRAQPVASAVRALAGAPFDPAAYDLPDPPAGLPAAFVSPVPLPSLEGHRSRRPGGLFTQIEKSHEAVLREEEASAVREAYLRLLEREQRRLLHLHEKLRAESRAAEETGDLRRRAEALLIHAREIPRGASRFDCPDPADASRTLRIDLDPAISPPANADRLFRAARRLERGVPLRTRRIRAIEEAVSRLSVLAERARAGGTELRRKGGRWLGESLGRFARGFEIERWESRWGEGAKPPRPRAPGRAAAAAAAAPARRRERAAAFHPRTYRTREGWTVLVGRSNAENDHVTHALARPDDYWFHIHGCPGSHVVLRREGRKDNPSVRTLEEAAAIAAWFSKARTSRKAPVVYTLKKYVRRPRKAPPGLAIVTREKTILVEPRAPEGGDPGGWIEEAGED